MPVKKASEGPDTREQWLLRAANKMAPWLCSIEGTVIPPYRISCGFPSKSALTRKNRRVGECWQPQSSSDNHAEIYVTPLDARPEVVLETVLHELIHASGARGHKKAFKRLALAVGFVEPMRSTPAGPALKARLAELMEGLGPYPHGALNALGASLKPADMPDDTPTKQGTRLRKVECGECGYTVRVTRKWLEVGMPVCPCGQTMEEQ